MVRPDRAEYPAVTGRNELSECHSRSPSLNSQTRSSGRHQSAVASEVGEIRDARAEPLLLAFANMARRLRPLQFAELAGEGQLLLVGQGLVMKDEDSMFGHALMNSSDIAGIQRFGAIDC